MSKGASRKRKDTSKRDNVTGLIFLIVVVVGILVLILHNSGIFSNFSSEDQIINMETQKTVKSVVELDANLEENADISYPGYESLTFTAGQKKQTTYLTNPKDNTCYFIMSLTLEDGTLLWQSKELMPGDAFSRIVLEEALEKGTYENAILKYEGYSLKDGRELNGSSITLNIEVQ